MSLAAVVTEMSALGEIGVSPPVDWLPLLKWTPERFWSHWRTRAARLRQAEAQQEIDTVLSDHEMPS
ncbi:hypothetical protein PoHVEF18_007235 [Penicillium ochrochloron]